MAQQGGTRLTLDDADALKNDTTGALAVAPEVTSRQQVSYLRWNDNVQVLGTWPEYFQIYDHHLLAGRYFNEGEVQGRRRVAVLGFHVMDNLGETPPSLMVGKSVLIGDQPFQVVGVLEEKGEAAFLQPDEEIFVPITTAQYRLFGGRERLNAIYAATGSPQQLDAAFADIDRVLQAPAQDPPRRDRRLPDPELGRHAPDLRRRPRRRSPCCWRASPG